MVPYNRVQYYGSTRSFSSSQLVEWCLMRYGPLPHAPANSCIFWQAKYNLPSPGHRHFPFTNIKGRHAMYVSLLELDGHETYRRCSVRLMIMHHTLYPNFWFHRRHWRFRKTWTSTTKTWRRDDRVVTATKPQKQASKNSNNTNLKLWLFLYIATRMRTENDTERVETNKTKLSR